MGRDTCRLPHPVYHEKAGNASPYRAGGIKMAYTISAIRTMIANENARRGFDAPNRGTVGALRLYKDGCGYALDEICTTGGVR